MMCQLGRVRYSLKTSMALRYMAWPLEAVHFELVGFCEASLGQPLTNVFALVSLQLQHLTVLGMLNHSPITSKLLQTTNLAHALTKTFLTNLFTCSYYFFQVIFRRQTLHSCQRFSTIPLLDSYVNQTILNVVICSFDCIRKRI